LPTRVDFGRVFPGLLILLIGIFFFAIWIVMVFVSFFAFFVPPLQGIFSVALSTLVASIVLMAAGGLVMLTGVSGWGRSWMAPSGQEQAQVDESHGGWFERVAERRAFKDRLMFWERSGEIFGVVVSFFFGLYFVESQIRGTGFFTSSFNRPEEFLFYGPWVFGMFVSIGRALYGRRNALRPFEAFQSLFIVVACSWFLAVFPFNFAHVADLLPQAVRFMFAWVNNDIGAIALVLGGIGSLASTAYTSVLYAVVRSELRHHHGLHQGIP